jgi:hypothetical protein
MIAIASISDVNIRTRDGISHPKLVDHESHFLEQCVASRIMFEPGSSTVRPRQLTMTVRSRLQVCLK